MKVKRFNNLWLMGIIITFVLLILFEIIKIFYPQFIIDIAEVPEIIAFGNYVETHKLAIIYLLLH